MITLLLFTTSGTIAQIGASGGPTARDTGMHQVQRQETGPPRKETLCGTGGGLELPVDLLRGVRSVSWHIEALEEFVSAKGDVLRLKPVAYMLRFDL